MDVHKALNRLEAETAVEIVAGARVHGLGALEKRRVEAFMRGLNRTRGLAFGHPGLGTTATRSGKRLIIQNDIGTTDAHVLVIHAEDLTVTITYTDIHRRRTAFFTGLCDGKDVEWSGLAEKSAENLGKNGQFLLVTGRYNAKDAAQVEAFLDYLGSRLVFMIDWNKARKALRNFVDDEAAIAVLRWAAARDYGHRGFLELGGAELIYEAIRGGAAGHVPYGTAAGSGARRQGNGRVPEGYLEGSQRRPLSRPLRAALEGRNPGQVRLAIRVDGNVAADGHRQASRTVADDGEPDPGRDPGRPAGWPRHAGRSGAPP